MRISFVIPTHNCAAWLPFAVKSVLEQTYKDVEAVIVNDGSTDSTPLYLDWLEKNEKKIKVIHQEKKGRSAARNLGNLVASGDVICVLDADDYNAPKRAAITVEKIKEGFDFIYGAAEAMDWSGRKLGAFPADKYDKAKALTGLFENRIVHSTVGYTKELALKYPYAEGRISELGIDDWEQQTRVVMDNVKMDFTPHVLTAYRMIETNITNQRNLEEITKFKKELLEQYKVLA